MTDTLSSTQTWTQLANGASLGGSGIFASGGAHKHKGGSGHPAASSAGTVSDPSLSFNKLFANDLSQNALSETDPSSQFAAVQQAVSAQDTTASESDSTSGSDETTGLSGPLAPGLLAYLMGLSSPPAAPADAAHGQATADAATAAAGSDDAPAVQAATVAGSEAGDAGTSGALQDILSEFAELSEPAPASQAASPSGTATITDAAATDTTSDTPVAGTQVAADQGQTDPAATPGALQATALVEMQKALSAYFSGSLTSASATAAATSIAI